MPALRVRFGVVLAFALAIVTAPAVQAQAGAPTAGTLLEGLEIRRPLLPGGPPEFIFSRDAPTGGHERGGRRFLVRGFHFVGNSVFSEALLRRVVERYVDLQLNLYDLNKAADAVTAYYRDSGYLVAVALVPAQKVEDGLVVIEVIEGRIGKISFDGTRRYAPEMLRGYVDELAVEPQLTMAQLERSMLLMNDLPGLTARATLTPGQRRGETDATLVIEEKPATLTLATNNGGRKEAGAVRIDITAELNNPLGIGDQLSLRSMRANDGLLDYRRLGYSLPLGREGLRLALGVSKVDYRVAGNFALLGIEGLVSSHEVAFTYPLLRSRVANVVASAGYRSTRTEQSALNTPLSAGKLSVVSVGANSNWVHADSSATTVSAVYSTNFKKNYGNNPTALRGKVDLDFSRLTGISPHWDLLLRANIVLGAGSVPDTEKFSLGGPDSVRGYRPGEYRGDQGFLTTVEFRRQFMIQRVLGIVSAFHDYGGVRNSGFASQDKLSSVGVGLTVYPTRESKVRVDAAWPTRSYVAGDGGTGARLWASASVSF